MSQYNSVNKGQIVSSSLASANVHSRNEPSLDVPRVWKDVIVGLAGQLQRPLFEEGMKQLRWHQAFWFCWHPSMPCVAASLLNRPLAYLYWGGISDVGLPGLARRLRLRLILSRANAIFVNDSISSREVEHFVGRVPLTVPYIVDTNFYIPGHNARGESIVIPGNNGRDEDLIIRAIRNGCSVTRVTSSDRIKALYDRESLSSNVRFRVSYPELRKLYQESSCVALPISDSRHAAGQTAVLEALACGAQVVVSDGRIAEIVRGYPSVFIARNKSHFLESMQAASLSTFAGRAASTHQWIADRHSIEVVASSLRPLIIQILANQSTIN